MKELYASIYGKEAGEKRYWRYKLDNEYFASRFWCAMFSGCAIILEIGFVNDLKQIHRLAVAIIMLIVSVFFFLNTRQLKLKLILDEEDVRDVIED